MCQNIGFLVQFSKVAEPEPEWWSRSFGFFAGAGAGGDNETPGSGSRQISYILCFEQMIWTKKVKKFYFVG